MSAFSRWRRNTTPNTYSRTEDSCSRCRRCLRMRSMSSIESKMANLSTANDLPQRLAIALSAEQRGADARARMSPQLSYGRHAGPALVTSRPAAVLLLLFRRRGRWMLPLTERPLSLPHHGGQISLPGGAVDVGESSCGAAMRELGEELGVVDQVEVLGCLSDSYVFA